MYISCDRYYSRDFDWRYNVVTIRQKEPLNKFQKNWTSKPMAIEGVTCHVTIM